MKAFIVCALLGVAYGSVAHPKWASYKAAHNKEYHPEEEHIRAKHFAASHDLIEEHNARFARGEVSYSLGHNHLSDMSHEEVKSKYLGKKSMSTAGWNVTEVPRLVMPGIPVTVDWRQGGIATPAKDQAGCGSCYSFGTLGVVESAIKRKTGVTLDLAEQHVVDCSYNIQQGMNGGCNGGHELVVMDFVSKNGVVLEEKYPYSSGRIGKHNSCTRHSVQLYGKGITYKRINSGNEVSLAEAVATMGPLVISISGENRDFQLFRGGIYDNARCPKTVDHLISLAGYGVENGTPYWLVKNSWGSQWGEGGFEKVRRGVNQCGIVSDHSYAINA